MKKLVLIDSNALVHRAFHALPPLNSPAGVPTNAVYGFVSVLLKMIADLEPDYIAATFDLAGPTFRHQEYEQYKAHRVKAPDELYAQIPVVKEVLAAFGIPIYEARGFEADDVIGSIVQKSQDLPDLQTIIVTGDLDTLQLVHGSTVVVFTPRKGMSDTVVYNEKAVRERLGVGPGRVADLKGLKGDASDNIPGVPGIGEKTAATLIQKFGTIEKLYEAVARGKVVKPLTEKLLAKLVEHKEIALFSKRLATIVTDVPIPFTLESAEWRRNLDPAAIDAKCKELGFYSLIKRIETALGQPAEPTPPTKSDVPAPIQVDDALAGHDLKPHLKTLMASGKPIPKTIFDTKIALWLLAPDAREYEYPGGAIPDTVRDLRQRLDAVGEAAIFDEIEMPILPILARMERTGIRVDTAKIAELLTAAKTQVSQLEQDIWRLAGTEFNINSPTQLGDILFNTLAISGKVRRTGGGAPSTAAPELEKLRQEHPIIDKVLEYRELNKLKNTYIEPFPSLVGTDGRIHTTYNQTGTATGRLSSSDPNLQNVPARTGLGQQFRATFVADPGFKLVSLDYSQLELRLVAHIAKDATMIEAFKRNDDIHTLTASEIFGLTPQQVTKDMRRQAKVLNFGIIYGMGILGFARAAGVSRETARKFIDEYFTRFAGVADYMERTKKEAFDHGFVSTLFGRRRPLADIKSTIPQLAAQSERMAINHPVQGTEADLMKLAMIAADRYIQEQKWGDRVRMLLQVHDELVMEVAEDMANDVGGRIKNIMEQVCHLDIPLIVDVKIGDNWADMKPLP
jgi:DNA polymerase-1